jgi:hypothetical protein
MFELPLELWMSGIVRDFIVQVPISFVNQNITKNTGLFFMVAKLCVVENKHKSIFKSGPYSTHGIGNILIELKAKILFSY